MKNKTLPVLEKKYVETQGKTAIVCNDIENGNTITAWANGNLENSKGLLCNITINEVGDTFVAKRDSKVIDQATQQPLYLAGDTVTRQKSSVEFRSLTGEGQATAFAQGASAFGLQLNVVMQG